MKKISTRTSSASAADLPAALLVNTFTALVSRYARRILRSAPALLVLALWLSSLSRRRPQSTLGIWRPPMKKRFASLPALALVAFAALLLMLAPAAFACPTPTVQTATTCNASQQAGTNGTTMCYSGTNSGNYVPFSLAALLNGTETLPVQVQGQPTATYLIKNDTNNTNFTLTYTGAAPSGSTQYMQCSNSLSGGLCQITGAAGTAAEGANYGPPSGGWPSTIPNGSWAARMAGS